MRAKVVTALLVGAGTVLAGPAGPPAAARVPVTDEYHGVKVVDDYRWLEDGGDPKVKEWSGAQNAWARATLDRLPGRDVLRAEVTRLRKIALHRYGQLRFAGGTLFALKTEPPKQQPLLVTLASEDEPASARVVLDPNLRDRTGGTSIDWYVPSPDGTRVAVSLSEGGSERGNAHVFETATGREVGEALARVNYGTAGGSLAWDADGTGFFYTRYPREGERPAADLDFYVQVYHHRIGSPSADDRYEIGKDFPRIAEIWLDRSPDGRFVLANVQNGDGGEFSQHLRGTDGRWTRLTGFADRIVDAVFGADDALYFLSRAGAPRGKVLRLPLGPGPVSMDAATTVVPEGEGTIDFTFSGARGIVPTKSRLYVTVGLGGPQQVRVFDLSGRERPPLPVPPVSAVFQVVARPGSDGVLFQSASFLEPTAWYRVEDGAATAVKTALTPKWPLDWSDAEVAREWAVSKDGTRVPLNVVRRKGTKLDGRNPTLLTGYGGYAISQVPYFDAGLRVWLDRGGVYALANLRGGSEFGEEWHHAGRLTRKQNVFDDFIACAEHLVSAGYTSPARLAIEGGSNGGLLMGAALTQRPDLFRAVVSHAGIYDMLRVELSPNGAFNIPEYGTVKDPDQFRALHGYSPYHRVADGRGYPAVLFLTGANDPRVDPMQSRKMTARLQAAGASPVLLRTSAASGHGFGTPLDEQIEAEVDVLSFLFERLGLAP
jgi:prolyl oligopeptidase